MCISTVEQNVFYLNFSTRLELISLKRLFFTIIKTYPHLKIPDHRNNKFFGKLITLVNSENVTRTKSDILY